MSASLCCMFSSLTTLSTSRALRVAPPSQITWLRSTVALYCSCGIDGSEPGGTGMEPSISEMSTTSDW